MSVTTEMREVFDGCLDQLIERLLFDELADMLAIAATDFIAGPHRLTR